MTAHPWPHGGDHPWGWHLRTATNRVGTTVILDADGTAFPSIRDLFWRQRLGMSDSNTRIRDEQLELMLAVLASLDRGIVSPAERIASLFSGAMNAVTAETVNVARCRSVSRHASPGSNR